MSHQILPSLGFAAQLSEPDREALGQAGEWITVEAGNAVIAEGQQQDSVYLVLSGALQAIKGPDGFAVSLGTFGAGNCFGEISVLDPGPASAWVVATETSQLWHISSGRLREFMQTHPAAAAKLVVAIATQLSQRLRVTNQKMAVVQEAISVALGH